MITKQVEKIDDREECVSCLDEPANTAFIHGETAHMKCCSTCAAHIMKANGKCPYCNMKAEKIVTVF